TISVGVELPPSCLRMASHRRPSRPGIDRTPERIRNVCPLFYVVNRERFPKVAARASRIQRWALGTRKEIPRLPDRESTLCFVPSGGDARIVAFCRVARRATLRTE